MCNLGQALLDEGIEIGEAKGKIEGKAEGLKEGIVTTLLRAIISNVKHYGVTEEQAMADLGIPENEYAEYKEMLNKEGQALT